MMEHCWPILTSLFNHIIDMKRHLYLQRFLGRDFYDLAAQYETVHNYLKGVFCKDSPIFTNIIFLLFFY